MPDWIANIDLHTTASLLSYGISGILCLYWALMGMGIWRRRRGGAAGGGACGAAAVPPQAAQAKLRFAPPPRPAAPSPLPPLSLLIPAHNASSTLRHLLQALTHQTYSAPWEVIIILDRCTDDTEGIVQAFAEQLPLRTIHIKETPEGWSSKKYALWRATESARYEWCIVLDADTAIPDSWLSQIMTEAPAGSLAIIGLAWLEGQGTFASYLAACEANLVQLEAIGRASHGYPYMSTGRGWAVRRVWLRTGLFAWREEISGDDDLTLQLMPRSGIRTTGAATTSAAPVRFARAWRRKWRHLQTARYYPPFLRVSLGLFPLLQMLLFLLIPVQPLPAIFPTLIKALALWRAGAPHPWHILWMDWLLILMSPLYLPGAWIRRNRW